MEISRRYYLVMLIIALVCFCSTLVYGAEWKLYSKEEGWAYYFDKDSIHYPEKKKGILGGDVIDKDIVGVWIKIEGEKNLSARIIFRCPQRTFTMYKSDGNIMSDKNEPIPPDNYIEQLHKIICK